MTEVEKFIMSLEAQMEWVSANNAPAVAAVVNDQFISQWVWAVTDPFAAEILAERNWMRAAAKAGRL